MKAVPKISKRPKQGTNHFATHAKAVLYYSVYGYDSADVDEKINQKEIKLGPPSGIDIDSLFLDKDGRYWIEG